MAIKYPPTMSEILVCDFVQAKAKSLRGFVVPEMIKRRPVAVVSTPEYGRCIIVCFSATAPKHLKSWHYEINWDPLLPSPYDKSPTCWALGDHVYTVSYERLSLFLGGKDPQGKRIYPKLYLKPEQLAGVRAAIRAGLLLEP
jgi:uncharacterized protein YifN (PemK superfamily)